MYKLLGIEGGRMHVHAKGSYSDGINGPAVGSFFNVNEDAKGDRSIDVTELWYEQSLCDDVFTIRFGKLDSKTGLKPQEMRMSFDISYYANDETSQFLNTAFRNNRTIPFPCYGLGAIINYKPVEWWYASAAFQDAQAQLGESGFHTTFNKPRFFYIFETGIISSLNSSNGPMPGAYRIGMWGDPRPKSFTGSTKKYNDDVGFYTGFDQMLWKENSNPKDNQGLGAFFRYGYADSEKNNLTNFVSFGLQYEGLFEGRDNDVLGIGLARGYFSDYASATYTDDYENVIEVYYNIQITKWFNLTPSVQYLTNPSGNDKSSDATVIGLRAQITF